MIFWLFLLVYELILIYGYSRCVNRQKSLFLLFIILGLIYFAGFRDGLGMDYTGYKELCEREIHYFGPKFLNEPIMILLQEFCYKTNFSAVLFFLINAILTNTICIYTYSKFDNFHIAAFIYIFYTGLYPATLNVVAQFTAATIMMCAYINYLQKSCVQNLVIVIISVLVGFCIHKSSIVMLFPIILSKKDYNIVIIVCSIIASLIIPVGQFLSSISIFNILDVLDYTAYLDYNNIIINKSSFVNIFTHILLIPFLLNKRKILNQKDSELYVFLIKVYVGYLICNNISAGGFSIAYRIAYLFVVFIPLLWAQIPKLINRRIAYILIIIPLFLLTILRISSNNRILVPQRILPLKSIIDENYHPYDNPNYIR
ncbi:MAG: EpsG family protein [Alistipes sp.]|nr:EpsG family protein [Alistipes sp.]